LKLKYHHTSVGSGNGNNHPNVEKERTSEPILDGEGSEKKAVYDPKKLGRLFGVEKIGVMRGAQLKNAAYKLLDR
jgi:hypothetical protein